MGIIGSLRDRLWHRRHRDEVRQILDAFTEAAFRVDSDPSLIDDEQTAEEFTLLGEICSRLMQGRRVSGEQLDALLSSGRVLQPRSPEAKVPGYAVTMTAWTAAMAEYRAAKALGDQQAMTEALRHVRIAAAREYGGIMES